METILHHLAENLRIHTEELRQHIRDETIDFRTLRNELTLHLAQSQQMREDVDSVIKTIGEMDTRVGIVERGHIRMAAWIAGAGAVIVAVWEVFTHLWPSK